MIGAVLVVAPLGIASSASAAPGDGAWQIRFDKVAPDSVASGVPTEFQLSLQCSALEAPSCDDAVVTIPLPDHIAGVNIDRHPSIVSSGRVNGAVELRLTPNFPAGASLQVGLTFRSDTITTPNNFSPEFTATVTGANTPTVSDSATATFTATPALGLRKRLPGNAPNGSIFPLDRDMRYTVEVCDTRGAGNPAGVLGMESATVVDTLPAGATFVSASHDGVYDAAAGTVTWQLGAQTNVCYDTLSVTVRYQTGDVDPAASVTNSATVTARPLGTTSDLTASSSVNHRFGSPTASGDVCKLAFSWVSPSSPRNGDCGTEVQAYTFIGPFMGDNRVLTSAANQTESSFSWRFENSSTVAGVSDIVDPIPCKTNSNGATPATYRSNAPGVLCTDPAWIVTGFRNTSLVATTGFSQAINEGNYPTYVTTTGQTREFIPHPEVGTGGTPTWNFTPQPGDIVAEIRWSNVPTPVATGGRGDAGRVYGYLAEDLNLGDRVTNEVHRTLTVGGSELASSARASLVAIDDTVVTGNKVFSSGPGTFALSGGAISTSQSPVWRSGLVLADLLPVELPQVSLDSATYRLGGASTSRLMPASAYRFEQIPDYQGTGRTLLRVTIPAGTPLTAHPTAVEFRFRVPGGQLPWIGTRTNSLRVFAPGHAIDRCAPASSNFEGGSPAATAESDDWNGDGSTTDQYCGLTINLTRASGGAAISTVKQVKGNLDTSYAAYPKTGLTDPSLPGDAGYRVIVRNTGGANLRDAVVYDLLPKVGDTGASAAQATRQRGSTFTPVMTGPVTVDSASGVTWQIAYSTAANPCRPEVGDGSASWPAGCTNDWTATAPSDLTTVTALRFRQTAGTLTANAAATSRASFSWPMSVPPSAQPGDVAWNTTATVATNATNGVVLLAAEPPKVGLTVPQTDVQLAKSADRVSGAVGQIVTFTVTASHGTSVVTNPDGSVSYLNGGVETTALAPATNVVVTDVVPAGLELVPGSVFTQQGTFDPAGVWRVGTIGVGEKATLTYQARITAAGNHTNRAELTGLGVPDVDSTPGNCDAVAEDDCASVTVGTLSSGIALTKLIESRPGSDDYLDANVGSAERGVYSSGAPIRYRFVVANTSQTDLTGVEIADPLIPFFCDSVFAVGDLAAGDSVTVDCTLPVGFGIGRTVNTATVTATTPGGDTVTAADTAQLLVPGPSLSLTKTTNGEAAGTPESAVVIEPGGPVTWVYTLVNNGEDELTGLSLSDDQEAAVSLDPAQCVRSTGSWGDPLPPGASITCTHTGTASAQTYANTAQARGRGVITPLITTASATSHYTTVRRPEPTTTPGPTTSPQPTGTPQPTPTGGPTPTASPTPDPSDELASTGASVDLLGPLAMAAVGLGLLLVVVVRRTRRQ
ncbi:MAG: DUF11 domain-containing protein [Propionicimonas sp.]